MPKDKKPFERYQQINDIFNRRRGGQSVVTVKELLGALGISLRQLRNDMEHLKSEGAPLEYVPALRGWRYVPGEEFTIADPIPFTADDVLHLRIAVETLAKVNHLKGYEQLPEIFGKIHRAVRRWANPTAPEKAIYFDPLPRYEGSVHLAFFLKSIEESRRVEFDYQAFHAPQPKTVVFDPWFLRHYDRRWYVGGFSHDPAEQFVRTFPLERIAGQPREIGFCHDKPKAYNAETYWRHIYGITVPRGGQVETVDLEFNAIQGKYFLSTPFFEPFEVLEEMPDKVVVRLLVVPNIDLLRKIASLGKEVKVLAPASLAEQVRAFFKDALERYEQNKA